MPHGMTRHSIQSKSVDGFFSLFNSIRYDLINNRLAKGRLNRMQVQPCIVFGWQFMYTNSYSQHARLKHTYTINLTLFATPACRMCVVFFCVHIPTTKCNMHYPFSPFFNSIQMGSYRQMKTWNNSSAHSLYTTSNNRKILFCRLQFLFYFLLSLSLSLFYVLYFFGSVVPKWMPQWKPSNTYRNH